jgi:hypothetical protein
MIIRSEPNFGSYTRTLKQAQEQGGLLAETIFQG